MGNAHSLTAIVPLILDRAGVRSVTVEESFVNQIYEGLGSRISGNRHLSKFSVSELHAANILVGAERRVVDQISITVDSVGRRNTVGVSIGRDAEYDLIRGDSGTDPSVDRLEGGAIRNFGTNIVQRSVGTDARGSPWTLQSGLSGGLFV